MNHPSNFRVFVIRAGLGIFFALFLTKFFVPRASAGWTAVLALLLVFSAYLLESLRKRQ